MKCSICTMEVSTTSPSLFGGKSTKACTECSLAESFVDVKSMPCIYLQGNTPFECGVKLADWRLKVLDTRQRTTDRLIKHP